MRKVALLAVVVSVVMAITSCNLNPEPVEILDPATTQGTSMVLCKEGLKVQTAQPGPSLPDNDPPSGGGSGSSC